MPRRNAQSGQQRLGLAAAQPLFRFYPPYPRLPKHHTRSLLFTPWIRMVSTLSYDYSNAHPPLFAGQERKKARTLEMRVLPHHFHDRSALNEFRPTGIVMNFTCVDDLHTHAVVTVSGGVVTVGGV